MSVKKLKQALDEMDDVLDMLKKEGESDGERSYREIVYVRLLLIFDALSVIRTLLCILLGFLAVEFFIA